MDQRSNRYENYRSLNLGEDILLPSLRDFLEKIEDFLEYSFFGAVCQRGFFQPCGGSGLAVAPSRATLCRLRLEMSSFMGGRAFGPPLCRGCAPATPPYKTIPHRPCLHFPSIVSGERSLLPHLPLQPTDHRPPTAEVTDPWPLTPAVPRPRNAPLQKHASPTVFTLPQHRVWRTESTPPLAASTHRPLTPDH